MGPAPVLETRFAALPAAAAGLKISKLGAPEWPPGPMAPDALPVAGGLKKPVTSSYALMCDPPASRSSAKVAGLSAKELDRDRRSTEWDPCVATACCNMPAITPAPTTMGASSDRWLPWPALSVASRTVPEEAVVVMEGMGRVFSVIDVPLVPGGIPGPPCPAC